jgi:hypothetical protein
MRLHGYCARCHKIKMVRVRSIIRRGVQIGICADCEERKSKT